MNLGKNVYNLLKRQSEVYVSGLGTFKRNHTPSTFDEKRNVYLPPIDYIDFESNSDTGYDFISYIQQLDEIERSDAQKVVQETVQDLLNNVRDQGQVKLDDLGYLVSYGEGYVFKALDLSGFNYEPVEALESPVAEQEQILVQEESQAAVEANAETVEQLSATETADNQGGADNEYSTTEVEEAYVEKSSNNTIWYVLIAVAALGVLAVLYFRNTQTSDVSSSKDSLINTTARSNSEPVEDTVDKITVIDTAKQVDTAETHANAVLVPASHTWQIVIGSHRTLAQAYEQAESYNKAGYPKVRVVPSNLAKNRKKVIWDSYETKAQLDSALMFVQKHIIKDAWPDKINR